LTDNVKQLLPELPSAATGSNGTPSAANGTFGKSGAPPISPFPTAVIPNGQTGTPFVKPFDAFATTALLQKQAALAPPSISGPFPASFYSSFPTPGKEIESTMYYVTSAKSFSSGTYYAVLNGQLQLIGQAKAPKKADAISAAENMAKQEKVLDKLIWSFEERNPVTDKMKKVNLLNKSRESTGIVPLLTHALAVAEHEKARFAMLEWHSMDKGM
jgi:hypothetical protein